MLLATGILGHDLLVVRDLWVNFYVLRGPEGLVCLDAGWRPKAIRHAFAALPLDPEAVQAVLLTHRHWDHAWGCAAFPRAKVIHAPAPQQEVCLAGLHFRVLKLSGHTPDSRAYLTEDGRLFTGDAVRLKGGKARPPFLARCPSDIGLRQLAELSQLRGLYTSHWGCTQDPVQALAPWRSGGETRS